MEAIRYVSWVGLGLDSPRERHGPFLRLKSRKCSRRNEATLTSSLNGVPRFWRTGAGGRAPVFLREKIAAGAGRLNGVEVPEQRARTRCVVRNELAFVMCHKRKGAFRFVFHSHVFGVWCIGVARA